MPNFLHMQSCRRFHASNFLAEVSPQEHTYRPRIGKQDSAPWWRVNPLRTLGSNTRIICCTTTSLHASSVISPPLRACRFYILIIVLHPIGPALALHQLLFRPQVL